MANMTSWLEEKILEHILKDESYTPSTAIFVGLVNSSASEEDLEEGSYDDEITGYSGDRKEISFSSAVQSSGKGTVKNTNEIDFEDMPDIEVEYAILTDSSVTSSGNMLYWCPSSTTKTVNSGDTYRIESSALTVDQD